MNVKILSDSASDIPKELLEKYGIDVLPIVVLKDDEEFLDGVTITPNELYSDMRNDIIYKTAQIPPNIYKEKFEEYAKEGVSVIYLAFSSGLSGTYQTSTFVRESVLERYPEFDIDIIDTKAATLGLGLIVLEAAKLAQAGEEKSEIIKRINFYKDNIEHIFTVDDMEYLFKGGRVSRTQALVGGLLDIKPVLEVGDGKLVPLEKARGKNKSYKIMINLVEERLIDRDQIIAIAHGDNLEGVNKLKEMLEEKLGINSFLINTIGCAIGAHSGPGTVAIMFFKNKYKN